ncbi:ribonucleoside-diphosphate reductase subunit alpha [Nocardiopsis sp. RSe5-2]|uniref:Ribonucleoside-diphosphate reductase n=1 Tax=Nocardiopsis endophytica TaxID=3018445 RepID=A0ABT4U8R3_9ACTN|nr:ribonucleoside-diphosphate reductase subunit alpha [Nocardiopsis endophytica]MDA2813339.1 ribonucleoside-diphosphate reductase subunit alpha [Nocardiopsis endophytica]
MTLDTEPAARIAEAVREAAAGLPGVRPDAVEAEARRGLYPGIRADEVDLALVMAARSLVEEDPDYSPMAARLLLGSLRREALTFLASSAASADSAGATDTAGQAEMAARYPAYLADYVARGVELGQLDPELEKFDLDRLGAALRPERDLDFTFLGLQTLYDRYFLHSDGVRYELPQAFFMRVAMGLALEEDDRDARAAEFYDLLSSFDFMCSTPTLFNAGTRHAQLSSCFLTTVDDDLEGIFKGISDNALLSKYSGGLGNDWTPVRGIGAHIRGTNGKSQGVVPFLKIANDTAVAVNQGGKRKGAVCAYLETWHIDVEEFLDLRKNTGDERRRTHDMNTANWVPDLFMRRVEQDAEWTLFSPDETPDLHDLYGREFTERYEAYERAADEGRIRVWRRVRAVDLWRRMLTMLFETGHPWITFKDPCNLRSPQRHAGVVHSSNLCTEITLNTKAGEEVAVCNLGSVNLARHVRDGGLDSEKLERTVRTAVRMLDNVIDVNFYTIPEARTANMRHRPVGLGLMGHQDALFQLRIPMGSQEAVEFADSSMELISYHAIAASSDLAAERGAYASFDGSLWSRGVLPIDSLEYLAQARGGDGDGSGLDVDRTARLDWDGLRERVRAQGMRNSNVMAIAPTATIANITGVGQSIEPIYRNLFVKSNMSGDFTVVNPYLVRDLKERGLWDDDMVARLKLHDGSLGPIERVPEDLKELYATAFEVDPEWLVDAASRRQKWIDQAQSLNLYMAAPSGRKLDALYRRAWKTGLKTTYYLRSQSATHVEKSTLKGTDGRLNAVAATPAPSPAPAPSPVAAVSPQAGSAPEIDPDAGSVCSIDDPECEACQ